MAIPKVCGIETEYGISVRGTAVNPVVSSTLLINSYLGKYQQTIGWDFQDEHPGTDARGFSLDDVLDPDIEMHLVNRVLTNGARYYVDHAHPEISTPECRTVNEVVLYDRAADEIIRRSMKSANEILPSGSELVIYKNNSDGKGNSYGC
ncbi:MAG: proteasome accessory factor PafA2 family protein, partial [Ilumatobacteraceae bacterium]